MADQGFEIISVAQDTGGEAAAGEWFDKAGATYTQIVDENHLISRLYNMVNVPTGVWIDEDGVLVRPNETAFTTSGTNDLGGKTLTTQGAEYVAALRDWVAKGAASEFAMSREEITAAMTPRSDEQADAEAYFQLANHFHREGQGELADRYWQRAQELRPESWNYHRQDWSFTPSEAGPKWMKKYRELGEEEYYPPLDLPGVADE